MAEEIFRKKSLDKIKSPESLNDYVRVSNPAVWLIIAAVIILLAGACTWGIFGRIETKVPAVAVVENGTVNCLVGDEEVNVGMKIIVGDSECYIENIQYQESGGTLYCIAAAHTDAPDGRYEAEIVTESISPMSFVFN